jgi:5'-methylthioadenosine phosphorylase
MKMKNDLSLAIIGGSGLYSISGLTDTKEFLPDTPFGKPSAPIVTGILAGEKVAFLARHGIGHTILPSEVNYRANIMALKSLGVDRIIGINACGSLREDYAPGHFVIPDQIYDNTRLRANTFFGGGFVAHIGVADPICPDLSTRLEAAVQQSGATIHRGGTLLVVEGPRFSTKAESHVYRKLGMSIIGMTSSPEVFLAREAEICYTILAHITDYDVWHESEEPVTAEKVLILLSQNTTTAQTAIRHLLSDLDENRACACRQTLSNAIITNTGIIPSKTIEKLGPIVKKYLMHNDPA